MRLKSKLILSSLFCLTLLTAMSSQAVITDHKTGEAIRYLPVQDGGRVKPFDTFAKEVLEVVYGKSKYKTENGKNAPAHLVVLTWILAPESWVDRPLFEVNHLDVKTKLNLSFEQKHFSSKDIFESDRFLNLMQELADKVQSKEKLTPYFQALQRLQNQMLYFRELTAGRLLKVMPDVKKPANSSWIAVADLGEEEQKFFIQISQSVAVYLGALSDQASIETAGKNLDNAVIAFVNHIQTQSGVAYDSTKKVSAEVFYNDAHLFRWAYVLYILSSLVILFIWIRNLQSGMNLAWGLVLTGFILHTSGFLFRVYLAERPPVTNMFETVVWMSWGVLLFSMILEKIYKFKSILLAGTLVGFIAMVIADNAPAVLDPSLQPLEAVLRSNYWLIVHVMTITISYSAFALAFGLGDIGLIYWAIDSEKYKDHIQKMTTAVYRSIQIGVAFLTPGIILGGIWADYSWGRFWGWDPKETWALIALLGYIIVLHTRLTNWIGNLGMLISGVLTFNLIVMAWYGVNYILGAGLHSYGFGAGGVEYVAIFVVLHLLLAGYVAVVDRMSKTLTK